MAWLPTATYSAPGVPLYGQGGSPNLDLSTLTLEAGGTSTILECFPSTGRLQTITGSSVIEISLSGVLGGVSIVDANGTETLFANDRLVASSISTMAIAGNVGFFDTLSTTVFEADQIYNSTISTSQIDIDGQTLNATPTELLLNGLPVATTSNLSSIADWALDPAISTVQMNGNDLIDARNLFAQNLGVSSIYCSSIYALNAYHMSTYTSTISSVLEVADLAYFSSVNSGNGYFDFISCGTLNVDLLSTQGLFVSSLNGAELTTNGITISSIVTESISTLSAEIRQGLFSTIVFSPKFEFPLNFNFDFKPLAAAIGAGLTEIAVGVGGGLVAVASGLVALAVSRSQGNITNNFYEQYAVPTQFQFSTLGEYTSSFFRYVSSSGLPNSVPGVELIASTIIAPGTLAVRSVGDPVNLADPSTVTSSIQAYGQWVALPAETTASTFSTLYVGDLTANRITTSSIVGGEASLLTIGAPLIYLSTAAVGGLIYTDGEIDALRFESQEVWTSSIQTSSITASTINGVPVEDYLTSELWALFPARSTISFSTGVAAVIRSANTATDNMAIGAQNLLLLTGFTQTPNMICSTLSTAYIQGANPNLFGLGVQGLEVDAENIFLSTNQTNITGFTNCSTVGAFRFTGREANLSTLNIAGLSTVTLSTLGTAGAAAQPAGRLGVIGNDVDFGQQDLWCQQIRLGAGNATNAQTEIIFYDANNNQRGLQTALLDRTIRVVSTINANQGGYLLDTGINPPFFSTLANTSTALMAFFPSSINSTIGASTVSIMPQINYFGSWYSSTSQTVAGANTETPLTYNSESMNVGGFTYAGSTITVPVSGRYEITHSIQFDTTSGGTNNVNFWLKKNGVNIEQSASIVSIVNNGETLGTISIFDTAAANDQYAVSIYSADNNMTAAAVAAAGAVPGIPSIITNIKRLG